MGSRRRNHTEKGPRTMAVAIDYRRLNDVTS